MRSCRYETIEQSRAKGARYEVSQFTRLIQSPSLYNFICADFESDFYKFIPKF